MSRTLSLELSDEISAEVERLARERGVTSAEFVAAAAAEKIGAIQSAAAYFADRAARAKPGAARRLLTREGGEPPRPGDEAE